MFRVRSVKLVRGTKNVSKMHRGSQGRMECKNVWEGHMPSSFCHVFMAHAMPMLSHELVRIGWVGGAQAEEARKGMEGEDQYNGMVGRNMFTYTAHSHTVPPVPCWWKKRVVGGGGGLAVEELHMPDAAVKKGRLRR